MGEVSIAILLQNEYALATGWGMDATSWGEVAQAKRVLLGERVSRAHHKVP